MARQRRGDEHGLVERVDHRVRPAAEASEERANDGGEDGDTAERERVHVQPLHVQVVAEQHDGDGGDGIRLEQVGRHACAVADVVADVVRDHRGVARVVLGDAGLDLPDQVGADVGGLRVDAAAESREDRDQRAAEREADQVADGGRVRVAEPVGEHPVVPGDAEQAEPDDEQPGDGAGLESDLERGTEPASCRLRRPGVRAHGDVHADEARGGGEERADQEADGRAPAELVVDAEQDERHDRDESDRRVLLLQVRRSALLDGARDLLHPLVTGRELEQPLRQVEPVGDRDQGAHERDPDSVVLEPVHRPSAPRTK